MKHALLFQNPNSKSNFFGTARNTKGLREAILRQGGSSEPDLTIVHTWKSVNELIDFSNANKSPWVLIEQIEGGIAIGPIFNLKMNPCFTCYLSRRKSNGGKKIWPVATFAEQHLRILSMLLAELKADKARLVENHIEIKNDGTITNHSLIPIPTCDNCWKLFKHSRKLLPKDLVSKRVGIINSVDHWETKSGLHFHEALGSRTDAFASAKAFNSGFSVDSELDRSFARAVNESLERYCAAFTPRTTDCESLYSEHSLIKPLDFQHINWRNVETKNVRCVEAFNLKSGEKVLVPASLVCLPYVTELAEPVPDVSCSVGLAAHGTIELAIEHAKSEILEHHVLTHSWLTKSKVEKLQRQDNPNALGLQLFKIKNKWKLEVVVAFLETDKSLPYFSSGVGTHRIISSASEKAIYEAVLSQEILARQLSANDSKMRSSLCSIFPHAFDRDLHGTRQDWIKGTGLKQKDAFKASLSPMMLYVDITTPDVAAVGISVVRVLAPNLMSLYHHNPFRFINPHPFN